MSYMKSKGYVDAKDYAGECEPIVIMTKGQSNYNFSTTRFQLLVVSVQTLMGILNSDVQGTCKYGTRVDYVLSSPNSPYKFVPGSYSVVSSKGTSDHHIVKVDITKKVNSAEASHRNVVRRCRKLKQKVKRITPPCSATSVWGLTPPPRPLSPHNKRNDIIKTI